MYSVTEAIRHSVPYGNSRITRITDYNYVTGQPTGNSFDWFYTPTGQSQQGYANYLLAYQLADGHWYYPNAFN